MNKILFISYGGGHCRMLLPVILYIKKNYPNVESSILGLTSSRSFYKKNGLAVYGYKDFFSDDEYVRFYGKQFLKNNQDHMMDEEESICYLGASFKDLVENLGEKEAWNLYNKDGRMAFFPLQSMKKIIGDISPDIIVTTNSPRSEHAAVVVGKEMGIPTLSVVDLFGVYEEGFLEADTICVPFKSTKNRLQSRFDNTSQIVLTGQPNLNVDTQVITFPPKNIFLWCDQPAYFSLDRELVPRTNLDILRNLDDIYHACQQYNWQLIIRPHPSQDPNVFLKWAKNKQATFDREIDVKDSILRAKIVSSISSTVLVEAAAMGKFLIKYHTNDVYNNLPLEEEYNYMLSLTDLLQLSKVFKKNIWEKIPKDVLNIPSDSIQNISNEIIHLLEKS